MNAAKSGRPARRLAGAVLAVVLALAPVAARAQSGGLANTLSGFSADSNKPIGIRSDVMELHDRDKFAVFSGNVTVTQEDVTIRTGRLKVEYEGNPAQGEGSADQRISRIEAFDKVLVTVKDQKLSGDHAVFEMKKQVITVDGNVVLSQGGNVLRGNRLTVDLESGRSRLESGSSGGGRVRGSFVPEQNADPGAREGSGSPR